MGQAAIPLQRILDNEVRHAHSPCGVAEAHAAATPVAPQPGVAVAFEEPLLLYGVPAGVLRGSVALLWPENPDYRARRDESPRACCAAM